MDDVVNVKVIYCGGCGYKSKMFQKLDHSLTEEFGSKVDVTGIVTPNVTGWFEVEVNGKLVHSKKNGDGHVDSDITHSKITEAVRAAQ